MKFFFLVIFLTLFYFLYKVLNKKELLENLVKERTKEIFLLKERYEQFVKNIGSEFVIYSYRLKSGKLVYISSAIEKIFELKREDMVGATWLDLMNLTNSKLDENLKRNLKFFSEQDKSEFYEIQFITPSNKLKICNVFAYPIKNSKGKTIEVQGIIEDITMKKKQN